MSDSGWSSTIKNGFLVFSGFLKNKSYMEKIFSDLSKTRGNLLDSSSELNFSFESSFWFLVLNWILEMRVNFLRSCQNIYLGQSSKCQLFWLLIFCYELNFGNKGWYVLSSWVSEEPCSGSLAWCLAEKACLFVKV
jgi:hypothetical protein